MMENMTQLIQCFHFAAKAHSTQTRKGSNNEPYVNHLIEVAMLISTVASIVDLSTLQAAILHDVLEDTDTTEVELKKHFGSEVTEMVISLTDDKSLAIDGRRRCQIEHAAKFSDALKIIKLADHCSNIASIPEKWNVARIKEYLEWSFKVADACSGISSTLDAEYKKRYLIAIDTCESLERRVAQRDE